MSFEWLKRTAQQPFFPPQFQTKYSELRKTLHSRHGLHGFWYQNRVIYLRHWMTSTFCLGNRWPHPGPGCEREIVAVTALIPFWAPQHARNGHQPHSPILSLTQTIMALSKWKSQKTMNHPLTSNCDIKKEREKKDKNKTLALHFQQNLNICWTHHYKKCTSHCSSRSWLKGKGTRNEKGKSKVVAS